jgi:ribonuclease G
MEAATEIARQLRLRDIGGMIILDFIDMEREADREKVYAALTEALAEDRTKSRVVEISSLGLVEMTRKNVTDGLVEVLTETCPTCGGLGRVVSDETLRIESERAIIRLARTHRSQAFLFAVGPKTLDLLLEPGHDRLAEMRKATEKSISLMADPTCRPGEVKLVIEGKVPQVEKHLTMGRAGTFLD